MKSAFLFLVLSFTVALSHAQSDSSKLASNSAISYQNSFWHPAKFFVDGKQISFAEVNTKLMGFQQSANEFNEYRKYKDLTLYTGVTAIAFLVASAIATGNSSSFKNTSSKVFFGVGCGLIIPEFIFARKRNRHFNRSFTLYNQQFH